MSAVLSFPQENNSKGSNSGEEFQKIFTSGAFHHGRYLKGPKGRGAFHHGRYPKGPKGRVE